MNRTREELRLINEKIRLFVVNSPAKLAEFKKLIKERDFLIAKLGEYGRND